MTYFVNAKLPFIAVKNAEPKLDPEPVSLYDELSKGLNCDALSFERLLCFFEQRAPEQAKIFHMKLLLHIAADIKDLSLKDHFKFHSISEETISLTLSEQLYLIFKGVIKPRIKKMICPFSVDDISSKSAELQAGFLAENMFNLFMQDTEKFLINHLKTTYR